MISDLIFAHSSRLRIGIGLIAIFSNPFGELTSQQASPFTSVPVANLQSTLAELTAAMETNWASGSLKENKQTQAVGVTDDQNGQIEMKQESSLFPGRLSQDRIERLLVLADEFGEDRNDLLNRLSSQDPFLVNPALRFAWMREWPEFADHSDLMLAALLNDTGRVRELLLSGADPNGKTREGTTALMYASQKGSREIARALLAAGADPNAKKLSGETALLLAAHGGYSELVESLLNVGADARASRADGFSVLMAGVNSGSVNIVKALLDKGASVKATGPDGWTTLMYVAGRDAADIADLLIKKGANVNESSGSDGSTPLIVAASRRLSTLLKKLTEHGAKVNAQRKDGKTALILAAEDTEEHLPADLACVRVLLDAGGDPNIADGQGWTPLMYVAKYGNAAVAQVLMDRDAKVGAMNNKGQTALSIATQAGRFDVAEVLRRQLAP